MIPGNIKRMVEEMKSPAVADRRRRQLEEVRKYLNDVLADHCIKCGTSLLVEYKRDHVSTQDGKICIPCARGVK